MTDDTTDDAAEEQPDEQPDDGGSDFAPREVAENLAGDGESDEADVRTYLLKGALVLLVVLGVVATLQFYLSAQTAIRRFASTEFRPVFIAAFNLVVLLGVGVGVAQVVRRMD